MRSIAKHLTQPLMTGFYRKIRMASTDRLLGARTSRPYLARSANINSSGDNLRSGAVRIRAPGIKSLSHLAGRRSQVNTRIIKHSAIITSAQKNEIKSL